MDMTSYVLQSMHISGYGLRIMGGIAGRTAQRWENILRQVLRYHPEFLEITCKDRNVSDLEQYHQLETRLTEAGLNKYLEDVEAKSSYFIRQGKRLAYWEVKNTEKSILEWALVLYLIWTVVIPEISAH